MFPVFVRGSKQSPHPVRNATGNMLPVFGERIETRNLQFCCFAVLHVPRVWGGSKLRRRIYLEIQLLYAPRVWGEDQNTVHAEESEDYTVLLASGED